MRVEKELSEEGRAEGCKQGCQWLKAGEVTSASLVVLSSKWTAEVCHWAA